MSKEKKRGTGKTFLQGGMIALGLYLTGIFVLSFFLVRGLLPESADCLILSGCCFAAALTGSMTAAKRSLWGTMPAAMLNTGIFLIILLLGGITVWPETFWSDRSGIFVTSVLAGGVTGGVLAAGRKKRKKRGHIRAGVK